MDLFGRNCKITIFAWIFAIESKCCTSGGLMVTGWYTLVIDHHKYIVSSCNGIGYLLKQKICGMYVARCKVVKYISTTWLAFLIAISCKSYSYGESWLIGGFPLGSTLKRHGLGSGMCLFLLHHSLGGQIHVGWLNALQRVSFGRTYQTFNKFKPVVNIIVCFYH